MHEFAISSNRSLLLYRTYNHDVALSTDKVSAFAIDSRSIYLYTQPKGLLYLFKHSLPNETFSQSSLVFTLPCSSSLLLFSPPDNFVSDPYLLTLGHSLTSGDANISLTIYGPPLREYSN